MPLHAALKALSLAHPNNVDAVASRKHVHGHLLSLFELHSFAPNTEFPQDTQTRQFIPTKMPTSPTT
jgi:hypothetical protein